MKDVKPLKVAIIGSGCAGLGAAWALETTPHDVHVFEKNKRLGGHTNTQTWTTDRGQVAVDTGFIVMNSATYPNLIRFLHQVNVPIVPTSMTFGVSRDGGAFEWSGTAEGIFVQRRNALNPRMWRMLFDIIRFNQFALDLLGDQVAPANGHSDPSKTGDMDLTIGEYLDRHGYSQAFKDDYLIPMTAAVWSTSPDKASLDFPAATLVRFMWNHHLLSTLATRPDWLTIPQGSQQYIDAIVKRANPAKFSVNLDRKVIRVRRRPGSRLQVCSVNNATGAEDTDEFDHVIYACHGDEILPTLSDSASRLEEEILSTFQTTENVVYLHSDSTLMPQRRAAWTAWNYLTSSHPSKARHPAQVSLTYWMNLLQHIPEEIYGPVLLTMNPPHAPAADKIQGKYVYRHPLYTNAAVKAQARLDEIQNTSGLSYAGAWTKYGFHEDGFSSGLRVARDHLGARLPFEFVDSSNARGNQPVFDRRDRLVRGVISVVHMLISVLGWIVGLRLPV